MKMRKSTATAASVAGACLAIGMGMGMGPAVAGGGGDVSASLTGTGKVIKGGTVAVVDAVVTCPKGSTWSVTGSALQLAEIGDDDTYAQLTGAQGGKCTGKEQKVKLTYTAYYNPPIPENCSAEYSVDFTFRGGGAEQTISYDRGGASGNGPVICLT